MHSTVTEDTHRTRQSESGAVADALAQRIGQDKFRIWFRNSARLELADGYLKISVPNQFIATWLENHFASDLVQAVHTATSRNVRIAFHIDPQLSGHMRRPRLDAHNDPNSKGPKNSTSQTSTARRAKRGKDRKLRMTLDSFVVGPSNELAYNAAKAVVRDGQSPFNPLFIHGGYGIGKTHLLQGICEAVRRTRPEAKWLYMSAEDFANQFVLALKTRKLEAFRSRIRQTDLLAIDDIHFLASKPSTQEEFLYTFNTIDMAGKQVVLVSDAHPKMIGQLSDKLVNRFISGMVVKIEPPDLATRCEICRRYSRTLKRHIPENVTRYIAENIRTNVRELQGALVKLIACAALQNGRINMSMAKNVLAEHLERCDPIVHISDIESACAAYFGVTSASIHSPKKDRTVTLARHFSMYLARQHTRMSSCEIGRLLGNKNHATVLLACKKVAGYLKNNTQLNWPTSEGNKVVKARTLLTRLEKSLQR